jgi:hypothetical protein
MHSGNKRRRPFNRSTFVGFYGSTALKRALWNIARAEDRSLSVTCGALLRIGMRRYFESKNADPVVAQRVARLKVMLEKVVAAHSFDEGPNQRRDMRPSVRAKREAEANEFDKAVEAGLREF